MGRFLAEDTRHFAGVPRRSGRKTNRRRRSRRGSKNFCVVARKRGDPLERSFLVRPLERTPRRPLHRERDTPSRQPTTSRKSRTPSEEGSFVCACACVCFPGNPGTECRRKTSFFFVLFGPLANGQQRRKVLISVKFKVILEGFFSVFTLARVWASWDGTRRHGGRVSRRV